MQAIVDRELERASSAELIETAYAVLGVLASRSAPESGPAAVELSERLAAALDLGESALAAIVGVADRSGEPAAQRYAGTRGWLKVALGMRTGRADERLTLARQLPRVPRTASLLQAGKLAYGYASTLCEAVAPLGEEDCAKAEEILLGAVEEGLSATKVAKLGLRIKDVIKERDGRDVPPEDAQRGIRSWWRVSRSLNGGGAVRGWFEPELLALVNDRLGPLTKPTGPDDTRDHAQRMADALRSFLDGGGSAWNATLVIRLADQPTPQPHGPYPATENQLSTLTAPNAPPTGPRDRESAPGQGTRRTDTRREANDAASNCGAAGGGAAGGDGAASSGGLASCGGASSGAANWDGVANSGGITSNGAESSDGAGSDGAVGCGGGAGWPLAGAQISARLADGTPIEPWQARLIAFNAGVSALVLGSDGIPLYLGRRTRFVTAPQRRVLEALYETCACDECDVPVRLCQLDHVLNWVDNGTTDIDLIAPACSFHNRLKYQHPEWITVQRDQQGRWRYRIRRPRPQWARKAPIRSRAP